MFHPKSQKYKIIKRGALKIGNIILNIVSLDKVYPLRYYTFIVINIKKIRNPKKRPNIKDSFYEIIFF